MAAAKVEITEAMSGHDLTAMEWVKKDKEARKHP